MKKAILYLQFSSIELVNEKESVQKQYELAEKFCIENGIEIMQEFTDDSTNPPLERYYLDKALKYAKHFQDEITYFLVSDYSRISNYYVEFKEVKEVLQTFGIYIVPVNHNGIFGIEEWYKNINQAK